MDNILKMLKWKKLLEQMVLNYLILVNETVEEENKNLILILGGSHD